MLWYIEDVPVTKPVIGAGEVDREARTLAVWVRGGEVFSIIKGELSAVDSADPRT